MPCNSDTCPDYNPAGGVGCSDPCGIQMTREIWPPRNTGSVNAPKWHRDRVMYAYEDLCQYGALPNVGTPDPTTGNTDIIKDKDESADLSGRVYAPLTSGNWWENLCPPIVYGSGSSAGTFLPQKYRYWDNYPSEISFEPNYSDSWWYYQFDTSNGVTGKPCYAWCYFVNAIPNTSGGGGGGAAGTTYTYSLRKTPYTCPCTPDETYVSYELEDVRQTSGDDPDPYPLIWTVGTKRQAIAFRYTGKILKSDIYIRTKGNESVEDSTSYGPWVKLYDAITGTTGGELFSEIGEYEGLMKSSSSSHRYNCQATIGNNLAVVDLTFRPVAGVGDTDRVDSKIRVNSIVAKSSGNTPNPGQIYTLRVPKEGNPSQTIEFGQIRFENVSTESTAKNVPYQFHLAEPIDPSPYLNDPLSETPFKTAWVGSDGVAYISPQGSGLWKSRDITDYQDYDLPGGTRLRMRIQSRYDDDAQQWRTIWKIDKVLRYGNGYNEGDGVTYTGQNVYYLYYPSASAPASERVGVAIMISETIDGNFSSGEDYLVEGEYVNGWRIDEVRHTDNEFNMHMALISEGTADFTKDQSYTSTLGKQITVVAGWGIKDRAIIMGKYEFLRKEIEYATAKVNAGVPFAPKLIKPKVAAEIQNGKLVGVQILKPGKGLSDPIIEPIRLIVDDPPTLFDHDLYSTLIRNGETVPNAIKKAKGTGKKAEVEPIISNGQLIAVKIKNGGSGYSANKPPQIRVPYIAKRETTVLVPNSSASKEEKSVVDLMNKSPVYQKLKNTPLTYQEVEETDENGTPTKYKTTKKTGYSFDDYEKSQKSTYGDKVLSYLKPDVNQLVLSKSKRTQIVSKTGVPQEFVNQYLPKEYGGKATKSKELQDYLSELSTESDSQAQKIKKISDDQKKLISSGQGVGLDRNLYLSLSTSEISAIRNIDKVSSDLGKYETTYSPPVGKFATDSLTVITNIANKEKPSISDSYYSKDFIGFYTQYKYIDGDTLENTLSTMVKDYADTFKSMYERDDLGNRTKKFDSTSLNVAKEAFFNMPCATSDTKYLIRRYCPDPRPWTYITIRLGVEIYPVSETSDVGICTKCLQDDPIVQGVLSDISEFYEDASLADAFCVSKTTVYDGETDGQDYNVPLTPTLGLLSIGLMEGVYGPQTIYEGCHSYELYGNLQILHDLTQETKTFVEAVDKYGNPYDFICNRQYGDLGEFDIYNTTGSGEDYDPDSPPQLAETTPINA